MGKTPTRPIRIEGDLAYITLTKGYEAIIDAEDVPLVQGYNWSALVTRKNVYAMRRCNTRGSILMHREVACTPKGLETDHINLNTLDNRSVNLRIVNQSQNSMNTTKPVTNTSGVKGVYWNKEKCKWQAQIKVNGKNRYLGRFSCIEDAKKVHREAAINFHKGYVRFE
jgi:hypothetical protein